MSERWRGVLAALTNPDLRAVLAEALAAPPLPEARRRRAEQRLIDLGLVRAADGTVAFDDAAVREILAETATERPTGPERFLDGRGRIDRYPVRDDERQRLLAYVAERAFRPGEVLTEPEVNARLAVFADDTAALRRYLIDADLIERTRSGSQYALVESAD